MVTIEEIGKDGKTTGRKLVVTELVWKNLQRFGKSLRWKKKRELSTNKKGRKNERKKRSGTGNAV